MACGCNKNKQRTNSQLAREAKRAEIEAQKQAEKKEAADGKVPAPANG